MCSTVFESDQPVLRCCWNKNLQAFFNLFRSCCRAIKVSLAERLDPTTIPKQQHEFMKSSIVSNLCSCFLDSPTVHPHAFKMKRKEGEAKAEPWYGLVRPHMEFTNHIPGSSLLPKSSGFAHGSVRWAMNCWQNSHKGLINEILIKTFRRLVPTHSRSDCFCLKSNY